MKRRLSPSTVTDLILQPPRKVRLLSSSDKRQISRNPDLFYTQRTVGKSSKRTRLPEVESETEHCAAKRVRHSDICGSCDCGSRSRTDLHHPDSSDSATSAESHYSPSRKRQKTATEKSEPSRRVHLGLTLSSASTMAPDSNTPSHVAAPGNGDVRIIICQKLLNIIIMQCLLVSCILVEKKKRLKYKVTSLQVEKIPSTSFTMPMPWHVVPCRLTMSMTKVWLSILV